MNKPASKEPSMDEILSSIRQIIADEDEPQDGGGTASNSQGVAASVSETEADQAMMAVEETAQVSTRETPESENNAPITAASEVTEEPFSLSPDQMVADTSADADVPDLENSVSPSVMDAIPPLEDEPEVEIPPAELAVEDTPVMQALDTPDLKDALSGMPAEMVLADDIAFDEPEVEEVVEEEEPSAMPDPNLSADIADKLLEPATTAAVGNAFAKLGALSAIGAEGLTLDAIVREMLRPMLKEWLDENLPATVERMVEKEIERVSRGS